MSWNNLLFLSIIGPVATISIMAVVTGLGVRYRRELPKLPINESIEALKLAREEEEAKLGAVQDELASAREDIREGERTRKFLEEARPQMETFQSEMAKIMEAKRRAELEFESAQQRLGTLTQAVSAASEQKARLDEEIAPLRVALAETKARLERAAEDLKEYEAKRQEYAELQAKLPPLREEHERLRESVERLRAELVESEQRLEPLRKEKIALEGTIQGLAKQQEVLIKAIEELKRMHTDAGGVSKDHDPCQDLWEPYFPERHQAGGQQKEQDRLERINQQLKEAKVRFPLRTLYAFHTALKIQDISPLTVLAGISGTGKSLLPRLYAKCMGVHFLNLPVQPGWNSPQDLFGFYNYIEHKFKATPLARAMVQFDQYNRREWFKDKKESLGLEDQMMLVLLDEMNLARVEYYFSELLSRLEIRRSIDPSSSEERRKVEVPLEIGHALRGAGEKIKNYSVSLYPGENLLFTGTMNEDESTMSLSDKVLDRASILRFGEPAVVMESQPDMTKIIASEPLALSVWKRWQGECDPRAEIKAAFNELKEVMSKAHSPFGYRVEQAMRRYVAMYPDQSAQGQRFAIVDQIEQKVLPKLRGRELSTIQGALLQLTQLVSRLDDAGLVKAIEAGRSDTEGTFMWTGLDRVE